MSDSLIVIDAGEVLSPFERYAPGRVVIRNGRIEAVGLVSDVGITGEATRCELPHLTIVPGFIEPHVHGSSGFDVMDATWETMTVISRKLAAHGTTAFLPTTVSASIDTLNATIDRLSGIIGKTFEGAQPLGIHLEGPFINPVTRGTHRQTAIHKPDAGRLADWVRR